MVFETVPGRSPRSGAGLAHSDISTVKRRRGIWFKSAIGAGFALAAFLLARSFSTYRYVTGHLLVDHLAGEAADNLSAVERSARELDVRDRDELEKLLGEVRTEHAGQIAWFRIAEQRGDVLAATDAAPPAPLRKQTLDEILGFRSTSVVELREIASRDVLIVTLPFRFRFPAEQSVEATPGTRPQFKIAEVGLYMDGFVDTFRPLRRGLAATVAASSGLIAAMVVALVRLPSYLRGKEMEQQLSVARQVQQQLLPRDCGACERFDVAATFVPAYDVGGDYYDVFSLSGGGAAIVVGDVSGKGLPAALVMSLLHGAVRATLHAANSEDLSRLTQELNGLVHSETSEERYVTFFWGTFDPSTSKLRYVNAGHWPPLLARRAGNGRVEIRRLERGGPVLGLLPTAEYQQDEEAILAGDLILLYSDGVVEATDPSGAEFGEERIVELLRSQGMGSAEELRGELFDALRQFTASETFSDDVTIVAARIRDSRPLEGRKQ